MTRSKCDVLIDGSASRCHNGRVTRNHSQGNDTLFTERAGPGRERAVFHQVDSTINELLHLPHIVHMNCIVMS